MPEEMEMTVKFREISGLLFSANTEVLIEANEDLEVKLVFWDYMNRVAVIFKNSIAIAYSRKHPCYQELVKYMEKCKKKD